jgi:signal transduction histidine kinase
MSVVHDEYAILRDVMRILATASEPSAPILPILEHLRVMTNASGSALVIFEEPRLLSVVGFPESDVPSDEVIKGLCAKLLHGIHLNPSLPPDASPLPYKGWALAQVRVKNDIIGAVCLFFDAPASILPERHPAIETLIESLTISATHVRLVARHEKLGRNQSEFMRIVSHDLRSPLTSIQGFASMLEAGSVGELNPQQEHFVEKILSGISQMTSLVENFQDAGRYDPETGFYEMQRKPCDVSAIINKIVSNHIVPAEKQELHLKTVVEDDIPIIFADSNMLERAIINLVDNAIKYTPNGREIEVIATRNGDSVNIGIKDNGLGISPENQKLLFERHVRIPRTEHKRVKGSGLGLFIVRSVARRHGGEAWVESEEGNGSTFYIKIPIGELNM